MSKKIKGSDDKNDPKKATCKHIFTGLGRGFSSCGRNLFAYLLILLVAIIILNMRTHNIRFQLQGHWIKVKRFKIFIQYNFTYAYMYLYSSEGYLKGEGYLKIMTKYCTGILFSVYLNRFSDLCFGGLSTERHSCSLITFSELTEE